MERGEHQKTETDNSNTNQNESAQAARCVLTDQFQNRNFLNPMQHSDPNLRPGTHYFGSLPTIVITPPTPSKMEDTFSDSSDYKSFEQSSGDKELSRLVSEGIEMDTIPAPSTDIIANIARPPKKSANESESVSPSPNDNAEVICRYSSTPVRSMSRASSRASGADTDCSMLSINNASPIAPADSTASTPNRSTRSLPENDDNNRECKPLYSGENPCPEIMYVPPELLTTHRGQTMLRQDVPNSFTEQPTTERFHNGTYKPPGASTTPTHNVPYNAYNQFNSGSAGHPEYSPNKDNSWTDLSYSRGDISPVSNMSDPCCYPRRIDPPLPTEPEFFVYPSIYVSSAGLISVLLRNDMSVEMTVDRTIRVVSHNHMMAVATDSRGTAACLYHPAVKIIQMGTTTDIATQNFRARMGGGDEIVFSNGVHCFKLQESELQPTAPVKFTDILRDQSVNLLFSSEGYGESLVASCMQVAAQAEYANLPKGGVIVRINGVKVTQTGSGDVTVVTGAKFIRLSPHYGTMRLGNRFVDIEVEKDWTVKLTRGTHSFLLSKKRATVCNGKMEAGFDEHQGLKVTNLQPRHPLLVDPSVVRRPPARKPVRLPPPSGTPKRRPLQFQAGMGRGGDREQCF